MSTLGEDFPYQQSRVRDLVKIYTEIGPAGQFGVMMLNQVLARAEKAAISGDVVEILKSYNELKECE